MRKARLLACLAVTALLALTQDKKDRDPPPPTAEEILDGVVAPAGFALSVFASPPAVSYPTCLACAPTGAVFVGVDDNGSMARYPDRGRVLRCVDDDGDGKADRVTVFCKVDSPRGLFFADKTLYVLHPPDLTAFYDDDGDGIADRSETLVKGIGRGLEYRNVDHTTNGIRLGIDGWVYVAVGDYGILKAQGRDGRTLSMHGGGIVRVRPDGTNLEVYARGLRHIYDVAIDPLMNIFTRDNNNDGLGWDVRLSHIIPTGNYGYPSLFMNFADEIVPALAEYGAGAPTGVLYLDEPDYPGDFGRGLYTCEWGRSTVYRHPLTARGTSFEARQEPFVTLPRPTDMDVDGSGNLYISSWRNGEYHYIQPIVGYVLRVAPAGRTPRAFPALASAGRTELLRHLSSASQVLRLHAQREILRRGLDPDLERGLARFVADPGQPLAVRVVALYTFAQAGASSVHKLLASWADMPDIAEFALRALVDVPGASERCAATFAAHLNSTSPRVRLMAAWGIGRHGGDDEARRLVPLVADSDPGVAHVAINALVSMRASHVCFEQIDAGRQDLLAGCIRVLQALHDPAVVDGFIQRLDRKPAPDLELALLRGLCRLYYREADWDGNWWWPHPDTTGPYYKHVAWGESEKIGAVLKKMLASADSDRARQLLTQMYRHRIELPEALPRALELAEKGGEYRAGAVEALAGLNPLPPPVINLLDQFAASGDGPPALRARALRSLMKAYAFEAALHGFASLGPARASSRELARAFEDFVRDPRHQGSLQVLFDRLEIGPVAERELAYVVLVHLYGNKDIPEEARAPIRPVFERAWSKDEQALALLHAIGQAQAKAFDFQVLALREDGRPEIRAAAAAAASLLQLDRQTGEPRIGTLPYDQVLAKTLTSAGDASLGSQLFQRAGCAACHTVIKGEPARGPYLGDIGARAQRAELIESILKPGARITPGFQTQVITLTSGRIVQGFVLREGSAEIEVRTGQGTTAIVPCGDIAQRDAIGTSTMPEGLANELTIHELASLLAFLQQNPR